MKTYVISKDGTVIEAADCIVVDLTDEEVEKLQDFCDDNDRLRSAMYLGSDPITVMGLVNFHNSLKQMIKDEDRSGLIG